MLHNLFPMHVNMYLYCSKLCELKFKFKIMKKIFDLRKCGRKLEYDYAFLLHNIVRILFIYFSSSLL